MKQWKYAILNYAIPTINPDQLNDLGIQGWELITVINNQTQLIFIFKKELENFIDKRELIDQADE